MRLRRALAVAAMSAVAVATLSGAEAAKRLKKQEEASSTPTPGDRRDRLVAAPGTPFNGRAYWQVAAQCGGIYFKLNTIYSEAAISAKVIKPDPAAYTKLSKDAESASTVATAFFEAAERFLVADRKLTRDEAISTYDTAADNAGARLKTAEAAQQAAKPCPDLYKTCRGAFPQVCNDTATLTN